MMAMASWVKWPAVPADVPGPCDASAAPDASTIDGTASAKAAMRCLIPDVMATSSNGSDRDTSAVYDGFYLVGIVCGWQFVRGSEEEAVMKAWIGVSLVAAALAFASPAAFAETK